MGPCHSFQANHTEFSLLTHGTPNELLSFPSWCHACPKIEQKHLNLVQASWDRLMEGTSNAFAVAKEKDASLQLIPIRFFYDEFYASVFEWIPEVRPMFSHGIHMQGKMLANIMSTIVKSGSQTIDDEQMLKKNLQWLARTHNLRGIQHHWYDIFGLSMLHTIRKCTDPEFFTADMKDAWIALYSKMMLIMIPEVSANTMPKEEDAPLHAVFNKRPEISITSSTPNISTKIHPMTPASSTKQSQ